jgi:beta-glucosidase
VRYWVTINEPMVYAYYSYILGAWPPQEKSLTLAKKVAENMASAHIQAYKLIHDIYRRKNLPPPFVSIANNTQAFVPCKKTLRNWLAVYLRDKNFNFAFLNRLFRQKTLDFIGMNYYTRGLAETKSWSLKSLLMDNCESGHSRLQKNSMGWDIYPEGLFDLLLKFKKYKLPLFILENGICTADDALRWDFIRRHLESLHRAMDAGVKVLGYIYWSLLDNFEWDKGFAERFGLIEVDYGTYQRKVRDSALRFATVCKTGTLE